MIDGPAGDANDNRMDGLVPTRRSDYPDDIKIGNTIDVLEMADWLVRPAVIREITDTVVYVEFDWSYEGYDKYFIEKYGIERYWGDS